jgi:excisionase family DNA binding protein
VDALDMRASKRRQRADVAHELALHDGAITYEFFARVACKKGKNTRPKTAKRAAERFADWLRLEGVDVEVCDKALVFDRKAVLALALSINPSLAPRRPSPRPRTRRREGAGASMTEHGPVLITVKRAALMLDVGTSTLRRWLARKKPPFRKVTLARNVVRVRLADVESWIDARQRATATC